MSNGSDRKRITQSLLADPFFAEPAGGRPAPRPTPAAAAPRGRERIDEIDDADVLEEADFNERPGERAYADERTTVWDEPEQLDADTFEDDTADDEGERTTIWRGGDEPMPSWEPPRAAAPAPILQRPRTAAVAAAPAPAPRAPRPASQPVAPVVAAPRPRQVAQPAVAQTLTGSQAAVAVPQRQQASVALIVLSVLLAISLVAVVALAVRVLGESAKPSSSGPVATAGVPAELGSVIVMSTPSNAAVRINGQPHAQPTPTVITDLALNTPHVITVELPGYQAASDTLVLTDANPLRREYTLAAVLGSVTISTVPPGAVVSVNGEERGPSPVTVSDLDMSRTYAVTAMLDGYEPSAEALRWQNGAPAAQNVTLTLVASGATAVVDPAAAVPTAAPTTAPAAPVAAVAVPPAATAQPPAAPATSSSSTTTSGSTSSSARTGDGVPQPRPATDRTSSREPTTSTATEPTTTVRERPSSRSGSSSTSSDTDGEGTLSVQAIPYGQVWIDGRMVASETPLMNHELSAGPHQVKVYFVQLRQFSEERTVSIEAGGSRTITFRSPREQ